MVNVEDASCRLVMGIPAKEWYYLPSPGIVFYKTSSQAVLKMEFNAEVSQEAISHYDYKYNIMCVGDTILAGAAEAVIDENWFLLDNQ